MSVSASALLDTVDAAISAIAGGAQSIAINGQSFTLANLDTLWKMKRSLEAEIASEQAKSAGRGPFVSVTVARFR